MKKISKLIKRNYIYAHFPNVLVFKVSNVSLFSFVIVFQYANDFQPPFLRHTPFDPVFAPFLTSLFPLPSFQFHPPIRYFGQFPPTSRRQPLSYPNLTHQPSLCIINGFQQISKGGFYQ